MDTILLHKLNPQKWIYTDLLGRIQYKDIKNIKIDEVVKAFLLNTSQDLSLENGEFKNEDLLHLFDNEVSSNKNICFLLHKDHREFMNITSLCDIKSYYKSIDALQLFKIPTRRFQEYFYYHDVQLLNGKYQHTYCRLRHDAYYLIKAQQQ